MSEKIYNVLFLCTGNSARSIMAEALVATLGAGRFKGFSAGSKPGGTVNPFAVEQVQQMGYPADQLRSKSWDEFASSDAPQMDFIITVCDNAAGETCPFWPGHPATAHWGFADPAAVEGTPGQKRAAFETICAQIRKKVEAFVGLPPQRFGTPAIEDAIRQIGELPV
jgi:arsenate reductase